MGSEDDVSKSLVKAPGSSAILVRRGLEEVSKLQYLRRDPLTPEADQPQQPEEPVHFDLTDEDLFLNHRWWRIEVYRNKYKSYYNHFRLGSVCGELFEFEITGTTVYQRLLHRVEEDLNENRVTVDNGVVVDGNTLKSWDLKKLRQHEAGTDIRYCILSTVMPRSFPNKERVRFSEAFARIDEEAKKLGGVWDDLAGCYLGEDQIFQRANFSSFQSNDNLRQYGVTRTELIQRTYLLDVLDYLCNKEQFTRPLRFHIP